MPTETPISTPWLSVAEAAVYSKYHEQTISAALRDGRLRGNQPKPKGKWLIHRDDLDAWIRGEVSDVQPARVARGRRAS